MSSNDDSKKGGDKKLRGFAAHPEHINRAGRPKGSRNKSTLIKAQLQLDSSTEKAAEFLTAVMENDTKTLGLKEDDNIPMKDRIAAAKEILNKAIANEKDKLGDKGEDTKEKPKPKKKFSPKAVKKS